MLDHDTTMDIEAYVSLVANRAMKRDIREARTALVLGLALDRAGSPEDAKGQYEKALNLLKGIAED
jgi:Flp pilus assembly protein TadD